MEVRILLHFNFFIYLISIEQNIESRMMDTTSKEQQINFVDGATLQAVLSSMTEPEMQTFLDELNKTGKACM